MNRTFYTLNRINVSRIGPVIIYISVGMNDKEALELYDIVCRSTGKSFSFYELKVTDWDGYLTPWPMHMGKRDFSGQGQKLLNVIKSDIVPNIRNDVSLDADIFIAGYSLAGLFSLWAIYECDVFSGAVSCSGSLWYEGWKEYISGQEPKREAKVYLSLGDKEKNSRNQYMKLVEENTNYQKLLLERSKSIKDICFEMNNGGHFDNVLDRMARGISFVL